MNKIAYLIWLIVVLIVPCNLFSGVLEHTKIKEVKVLTIFNDSLRTEVKHRMAFTNAWYKDGSLMMSVDDSVKLDLLSDIISELKYGEYFESVYDTFDAALECGIIYKNNLGWKSKCEAPISQLRIFYNDGGVDLIWVGKTKVYVKNRVYDMSNRMMNFIGEKSEYKPLTNYVGDVDLDVVTINDKVLLYDYNDYTAHRVKKIVIKTDMSEHECLFRPISLNKLNFEKECGEAHYIDNVEILAELIKDFDSLPLVKKTHIPANSSGMSINQKALMMNAKPLMWKSDGIPLAMIILYYESGATEICWIVGTYLQRGFDVYECSESLIEKIMASVAVARQKMESQNEPNHR
ncbi:MAG: hypothetical protein K2M94_06340 [Paramuribaculum sp.]|nr:hypothetical protein [Paramuribaculum sp.]